MRVNVVKCKIHSSSSMQKYNEQVGQDHKIFNLISDPALDNR